MGTFYGPNGPVQNEKDYDVVKTVPPGMVLYNVNDPINFAFGPGTKLKLKNGVIVNTADSDWVLEEIETYRSKYLHNITLQEDFLKKLKLLKQLKEEAKKQEKVDQADAEELRKKFRQRLEEKRAKEKLKQLETEELATSDLEEQYKNLKRRANFNLLFGATIDADELNKFLGFAQIFNFTGLVILDKAREFLLAQDEKVDNFSFRELLGKINDREQLHELFEIVAKALSNEEKGISVSPTFIKDIALFLLKTSDKNNPGFADIKFDKDLFDDLKSLINDKNLSTLVDNYKYIFNFSFIASGVSVYQNILWLNVLNKFSRSTYTASLAVFLKLVEAYPDKLKLISAKSAIEDILSSISAEILSDDLHEFVAKYKPLSIFLNQPDSPALEILRKKLKDILLPKFFQALTYLKYDVEPNALHVVAIGVLLDLIDKNIDTIIALTFDDPDQGASYIKDLEFEAAEKLQEEIDLANEGKEKIPLSVAQFLFAQTTGFSDDFIFLEELYKKNFSGDVNESDIKSVNFYDIYRQANLYIASTEREAKSMPKTIASALLASPLLLRHLLGTEFVKHASEILKDHDGDFLYFKLMLSRKSPILLKSIITNIAETLSSPDENTVKNVYNEINNLGLVLAEVLKLEQYDYAREVVAVGSSLANFFALLERNEGYIDRFPFMKFIFNSTSFAEKVRSTLYEVLINTENDQNRPQIEILKDILLFNNDHINIEVSHRFDKNSILPFLMNLRLDAEEFASSIDFNRIPADKHEQVKAYIEQVREVAFLISEVENHIQKYLFTPFFDFQKVFANINKSISTLVKIFNEAERYFFGKPNYFLVSRATALSTLRESLLAFSAYYPKEIDEEMEKISKKAYISHYNLLFANFLRRYSRKEYATLNGTTMYGPIDVLQYEIAPSSTRMYVVEPLLAKERNFEYGNVLTTPRPLKTYIPTEEIDKFFASSEEKKFFTDEKSRGFLTSVLASRSLNLARQLARVTDENFHTSYIEFKATATQLLGDNQAKELYKSAYEQFKNFADKIKEKRHVFDHLFSDLDNEEIEVQRVTRRNDEIVADIKVGDQEFSIYANNIHPFVVIDALEKSGNDRDRLLEEFFSTNIHPIVYAVPTGKMKILDDLKLSNEALVKALLKHSTRHFVNLRITPKGKPFVSSAERDMKVTNEDYKNLYGATSDWRENLAISKFLHDTLDMFVPYNFKPYVQALYRISRINMFYTGWYFFTSASNDFFLSFDAPIFDKVDLARWKEDYAKYKDIVDEVAKEAINEAIAKEVAKYGVKHRNVDLRAIATKVASKYGIPDYKKDVIEKITSLASVKYRFVETFFHESGHAIWEAIDPNDKIRDELFMKIHKPILDHLVLLLKNKGAFDLASSLEIMFRKIGTSENIGEKYMTILGAYKKIRSYIEENFNKDSAITEFVRKFHYLDLYGLIIPAEIPSTVLENVFIMGKEEFLKRYPQYAEVVRAIDFVVDKVNSFSS